MTQLVGHDAPGGEALAGERLALENLQDRSLRVLEAQQFRDRRLGILPALRLYSVTLYLLLESIEIVLGPDLKSDRHALCLRALAHDDGVMVDGRCQIDRILGLLGD